jgi:hypothetical protein
MTPAGPRLKNKIGEVWDPIFPPPAQQHQPFQEPPAFMAPPLAQFVPEPEQHFQHFQHHHDQLPPPSPPVFEQQQQQFGDWPPGLPPYPVFYERFEQLCQFTERGHRESRERDEALQASMYAGFSSIFQGLNRIDPNVFPHRQFPFDQPGDKRPRPDESGPSGSHDRDHQD